MIFKILEVVSVAISAVQMRYIDTLGAKIKLQPNQTFLSIFPFNIFLVESSEEKVFESNLILQN